MTFMNMNNSMMRRAPWPETIELCPNCRLTVLWWRDNPDLPRYARVEGDARPQACYKCGDHYQDPGHVYIRQDIVLTLLASAIACQLTPEEAMRLLRKVPAPTPVSAE